MRAAAPLMIDAHGPTGAVRCPRDRSRAVAAPRSRLARQDDDLMAVLGQGSGERLSEKARTAGNDNGHRSR